MFEGNPSKICTGLVEYEGQFPKQDKKLQRNNKHFCL